MGLAKVGAIEGGAAAAMLGRATLAAPAAAEGRLGFDWKAVKGFDWEPNVVLGVEVY